jgi:hypothetical protein
MYCRSRRTFHPRRESRHETLDLIPEKKKKSKKRVKKE